MAWANINRRGNPTPNTSFTTNLQDQINSVLIIGRVIDIILNDSVPETFKAFGEWNGIGTIIYETIDKRAQAQGIAKPLDSNFKKFPLINELVVIIPSYSTGLNENEYSMGGFYLSPISLWNHPHHNAFPNNTSNVQPEQNKSYEQAELGSYSNVSTEPVQINLGNTFKERNDVNPLLPFEGDIIVEGRWGNSIRLGSTVMASASLSPNDWSTSGVGRDGDPIIILRNGQFLSEKIEGYVPIIESTYNSLSSIYLTSTQKIPIDVARSDYTSYSGSLENTPTNPKEYAGPQIILNSERLVFNASLDHILLSAGKSVNLNTPKSVNIDTRKVVIQSDNIFLGNEMLAKEPLMLGNQTVNLLTNLVDALISLTDELKILTSDPVIANSPASFTKLNIKSTGINLTLKQIKKQLSTPNSITSERNYTI
jgi:hypothetical protein